MRFDRMILAGLLAALAATAQPQRGASQEAGPQTPRQSARSLPELPQQIQAQDGSAQNPFLGGAPSGTATSQELPLSLSDAIERGLQNNLGALLSGQAARPALGQRSIAKSGLLPNLSAGVTETAEQINLAAFGFSSFPGVTNTIIGPFGIFDARVFLSQSVLDLKTIDNARGASESLKAADYSYEDARDVVVMVVAGLYLQAVAASSRIEAAQSQLNTAQALYDQAVSFKEAGTVPAIEVLRAQVELQARRQQVIFFQNEFEKQKLRLARAIGIPAQQTLRLTDTVPYIPLAPLSLQEALERAYGARRDYQSALASVRASELAKRAAEAERLPSIAIEADYGDLGNRPNSSHGTFTAAAGLRIPIFQGGGIGGDILQADALLKQRRAGMEDLHSRIEFEVRTAFLDLKAAGERVEVARSALDLAQQQVVQAQDRFAAGVTGNIEVVQAQEALSTAHENYIAGTYDYNIAKTSLARALGSAEKSYRQFLLGETR